MHILARHAKGPYHNHGHGQISRGAIVKTTNTLKINGKRYVCRIFDAGDTFADRYTIAYKGTRHRGGPLWFPYRACSENPFHPQGFGQYSENPTFLTGKHLGRRVSFDALPADVKKLIVQDLTL